MHPDPMKVEAGRLVMKGSRVQYRHVKDDNPSAAVHEESNRSCTHICLAGFVCGERATNADIFRASKSRYAPPIRNGNGENQRRFSAAGSGRLDARAC